jgi:hypothetical protein
LGASAVERKGTHWVAGKEFWKVVQKAAVMVLTMVASMAVLKAEKKAATTAQRLASLTAE